MKVRPTRPSDTDILYTVTGNASDKQASLLFSLEPVDAGRNTIVHTAVTVPRIKLDVNGKKKILSQMLVKKEVARILDAFAREGNAASTRSRLSTVLGALAIATDEKFQTVVRSSTSEQALQTLLEGADPATVMDRNQGWANGEFGSDNQGRRVAESSSYYEVPNDGSQWGD